MPIAEYTIPGMLVRDHVVAVPLDWSKPDGAAIEVFAREIVDPARRSEDLPVLCFLQGGPGGKSPRPTRGSPAWLAEALKTHRVVLPDQRGTGRSTPIEAADMARFADGEAAADYLAHFRADSIVADFEHVRKALFCGKPWETLGQSYGGFLTMTYLSQAPEGLAACYVAGGLPSLDPSADEVYRRTYPRVVAKNAAYQRRYPQDAARLAAIADFIDSNDVRLADGDRLTVRRLQTIGLDLGMGPGFENIHWLVDEAFHGPKQDRLSEGFLSSVMGLTAFRGGPLFAALHEAIYAQGEGATNWSAERLLGDFPEFDARRRPLLFTGEMIYPWMFEEIAALRPFKAGVDALAQRRQHSQLYDPARLAANDIPLSAVIYHDDMFVDAELSLHTARHVGNLDFWITNEFEHDGIRQAGTVFRRLVDMVRDKGGPRAAA
ncbi:MULTISPECIES: alpha/beta fold hydrolase [Phyllobacteriaceae]|jgi:pimeloyl-ACP methyl ester carboxylesterase|uniref:Proline iminopeptidase n=1 Tax=Mesorhizobium hungaricum TaxID=1566387 RepID=A0A1C2E576_9HYPH|nr:MULTISPECIES: alpha/beta fold hydrolase [Mesorhizobium]MBN9236461.1 alpha/beta fold hydrolase [Mesorhizobium sp.]MDQ0329609.1 proline iminopeptidase [Mesorhizobium sp. YL-MeA3-2017]OCX22151.1 proline iminopeptidase [Mesorhizobium hungaricum]